MRILLFICLFQISFIGLVYGVDDFELVYDFKKEIGSDKLVYIRSILGLEDTIWVCAFDDFKTNHFFKSTDRGKNFKKIAENDTIILRSIIYDGKPVYLSSNNLFFRLNQDNTFEYFTYPDDITIKGNQTRILNRKNLVITSNLQSINLSEDFVSWRDITPDISKFYNLDSFQFSIRHVAIQNDSTFYLAGSIRINEIHQNRGFSVLKTNNKGLDWEFVSEVVDSNYFCDEIFVTENGCIFIEGYGYVWFENYVPPYSYELVLRSCDDGKNWDVIIGDKERLSIKLQQIHFFNNNIGYAASPSSLYTTTNGGDNWKLYSNTLISKDSISQKNPDIFILFYYLDSNTLFVGTQNYGRLYKISMYSGIDEVNNDLLSNIYPNPAKDYINVDFKGTYLLQNINIQIYDLLGVMVEEISLPISNLKYDELNPIKINLSNLKSGIYILRIGDYFEKFIKN